MKVMWGNPTPFHLANSIEKIFRKDKYWQKLLKKISKEQRYMILKEKR